MPISARLSLALLLPLPCLAQTTPAPTPPPVQAVEVQGSRINERREDTASKTVITREEILRFGDTSLNDVLKRLPGITLTNGGIRLRGLGNGYTQILLNGEPAPPGFAIDSLPPDSIEKIEIVRSAVAEFSAQSIAGTINVITRRKAQAGQREVKYTYENNAGDMFNFLNLDRSDKNGPFSYTLSGRIGHGDFSNDSRSMMQGTDANGVPNFNSQMQQTNFGHFDFFNLNPKLNFQLANGDTLSTQNFVRYSQNKFTNREQTVLLTGGSLPNPNNQEKVNVSNFGLNTNLNWLHKLAEMDTLDVKLGLNYNKRDLDNRFLGNSLSQTPTLDRRNMLIATDYSLTFNGKYNTKLQQDQMFSLGLEGAFSKKRDLRQQNDLLPMGADVDTASQFMPINLDEVFRVRVARLAAFGQDEWSVSKNLSLYLGVRFESIKTTSGGDGANPFSSISTSTNTSRVLSPILQTLMKLPDSPNTQLRLAFARTYKAPQIGNLNARRMLSNNNSATRPDSQGNPDLLPELSSGLDVTLERFLADGGILSASSYVRRIKNVTGRGLFNINGRFVTMPVNEGVALSRGIELEAKFPLRVFVPTAPMIDLRMNLARNFSKVSTIPGPDNRLDGQTPVSGNIGFDYRTADYPLTLGGNFGFQNGGNVRVSVTESRFSSVMRNLDVFALWKFDKKTQLRLGFSDLLHQDVLSGNSFADASGSLSQSSFNTGSTSVRLTLEHKF